MTIIEVAKIWEKEPQRRFKQIDWGSEAYVYEDHLGFVDSNGSDYFLTSDCLRADWEEVK